MSDPAMLAALQAISLQLAGLVQQVSGLTEGQHSLRQELTSVVQCLHANGLAAAPPSGQQFAPQQLAASSSGGPTAAQSLAALEPPALSVPGRGFGTELGLGVPTAARGAPEAAPALEAAADAGRTTMQRAHDTAAAGATAGEGTRGRDDAPTVDAAAGVAPAAVQLGDPVAPMQRRMGRRLSLQPMPADRAEQQPTAAAAAREEQQVAADEYHVLFNAVQTDQGHENFTVAALPARQPAPYRRRLPAILWQRAGMQPPSEAQQQQQNAGEVGAEPGRPAGWPHAMRIDSAEVCTGEGRSVPDHPSIYVALRQDHALLADKVQGMRRFLLRHEVVLAAAAAAESGGSDSGSDDDAAGFGMRQGVEFDEEEEEDSELQNVLPPWDPLEEVEGSGSDSEDQDVDEYLGKGTDDSRPETLQEDLADLQGCRQEEAEELHRRRQELLQQLVLALGLDSAVAEEQALQALQGQIESALPSLKASVLETIDLRFLQAPARKAATALEGLAEALKQQESRWRHKELPALQQIGHIIWHQGRKVVHGVSGAQEWQADAALRQGRLLKQLLELLKTHLPSQQVSMRVIRRCAGVCETTYCDLLQIQERLRIAALPEQPAQPEQLPEAKPARRHRCQQQQHSSGQADEARPKIGRAAAGSSKDADDSGGEDEYQEDSWLAPDSEGAAAAASGSQGAASVDGAGMADADAGMADADADMADADADDEAAYASAAEELASSSQEQQEERRAWNAAGLQPGQTRVLVAPGRQHEGQQQQPGADEEPKQEEQQPAATQLVATQLAPGEPTLLATQLLGSSAAGAAEHIADDATSPTTQVTEDAAGCDSPLPSIGAVTGAMEAAGAIMGGGASETESAGLAAPVADGDTAAGPLAADAPAAAAPDAVAKLPAEAEAAALQGGAVADDGGGGGVELLLAAEGADEELEDAVDANGDEAEDEDGLEEAGVSSDNADAAGLPGRLVDLADMAPVEVLRSTDDYGLHWAKAYLAAPIRANATSAALHTVSKEDELVHFTCFNLGQLRPAVPISPATKAKAADGTPAHSSTVPALTCSSVRVGGWYEFNVLAASDSSNQRTAYVPAVVVRKQVMLHLPTEATQTQQQQVSGPGEQGSRISGVLDWLHRRHEWRVKAAEAPGTSAAAAEAARGSTMLLTLCWPGCRKLGTLRVTEQQLLQADAPLRATSSWSAASGEWHSPQEPGGALRTWHSMGLSNFDIEKLVTSRGNARLHDKRVRVWVLESLAASRDGDLELPLLKLHFRRRQLARQPCLDWTDTLQALGLLDRQAAVQNLLTEDSSDPCHFGLQMAGSGEVRTWNPTAKGIRVVPLLSPACKRRRRLVRAGELPDGPRDSPPSTGKRDRTLQRLDLRQQRRLDLGRQAGLSLPAALQAAAAEAAAAAEGEAAADVGDRQMVPLWEDKPREQQECHVYAKLGKVLKQHQREGLEFLWNSLVVDHQGGGDLAGGCILAHHMGLGKTLQTVTFLSSFSLVDPQARFLVLVPKVVLHNWSAEFAKWLPKLPAGSLGLSTSKVLVSSDSNDEQVVRTWYNTPSSVLVMTHDKFKIRVNEVQMGRKPKVQGSGELSSLHRQVQQGQGKQAPSAGSEPSGADAPGDLEGQQQERQQPAPPQQQQQQPTGPSLAEMLRDGPTVVVVDEAHVIKSEKAQIRKALLSVKTKRRLALTGYPLQNNLSEMHAMISWCDPDLISKAEWDDEYVNPIMAGQMPHATLRQIRVMNERLAVFHDMTNDVVHRRGEEILRKDLPRKREVVLKLALSPTQHRVYERYIKGTEEFKCRSILMDHDKLKMLCDRPSEFHGWLKYIKEQGEGALAKAAETAAALAAAIAQGQPAATVAASAAAAAAAATSGVIQFDDEMLDGGIEVVLDGEASASGLTEDAADTVSTSTGRAVAAVMAAEAEAAASAGVAPSKGASRRQPGRKATFPLALARELLAIVEASPPQEFQTMHTSKLWAVQQLLQFCAGHGEKLVLVAESLEFLRQVEELLNRAQLQLPGGGLLRWCKIEGATPDKERDKVVRAFERGAYQVFLISKAGTHGINLVSCRRIAVLEEHWNPVFNLQAIGRLFRYGQQQETFVYRLYYNGTNQYNIYLRNVNKAALFRRVIDRQSVKQLRDVEIEKLSLYSLLPDTADPQALATVQQQADDPALAALLAADAQQATAAAAPAVNGSRNIVEVEDHDKNLADDPSQRLTKAEKRQAAKQAMGQWRQKQRAETAVEGGVVTRGMRAKMERMKKVWGDLSEDEDELQQVPGQQQQQAHQHHHQPVLPWQQVTREQQQQQGHQHHHQRGLPWQQLTREQQQQQAHQQQHHHQQALPWQQLISEQQQQVWHQLVQRQQAAVAQTHQQAGQARLPVQQHEQPGKPLPHGQQQLAMQQQQQQQLAMQQQQGPWWMLLPPELRAAALAGRQLAQGHHHQLQQQHGGPRQHDVRQQALPMAAARDLVAGAAAPRAAGGTNAMPLRPLIKDSVRRRPAVNTSAAADPAAAAPATAAAAASGVSGGTSGGDMAAAAAAAEAEAAFQAAQAAATTGSMRAAAVAAAVTAALSPANQRTTGNAVAGAAAAAATAAAAPPEHISRAAQALVEETLASQQPSSMAQKRSWGAVAATSEQHGIREQLPVGRQQQPQQQQNGTAQPQQQQQEAAGAGSPDGPLRKRQKTGGSDGEQPPPQQQLRLPQLAPAVNAGGAAAVAGVQQCQQVPQQQPAAGAAHTAHAPQPGKLTRLINTVLSSGAATTSCSHGSAVLGTGGAESSRQQQQQAVQPAQVPTEIPAAQMATPAEQQQRQQAQLEALRQLTRSARPVQPQQHDVSGQQQEQKQQQQQRTSVPILLQRQQQHSSGQPPLGRNASVASESDSMLPSVVSGGSLLGPPLKRPRQQQQQQSRPGQGRAGGDEDVIDLTQD